MPAEVDRCVRRTKTALVRQGKSEKEAEQMAWAICTKLYKQGKLRRDGIELEI